MKLTLAVDFGSTYTKLVAFNLEKEEVVAVSQSKTTVDSDITIGLNEAISKLKSIISPDELIVERFLSCSSAAGGLNMIAIGLTKTLTTKAATQVVLGAGAKLTATYANGLNKTDIDNITKQSPDLILLAGGTDGGNVSCIIENATLLSKSNITSPIIIAGNKIVADKIYDILSNAGKYAVIAENILPELDILNTDSAKNSIREIFIERIIHAKGLDKAKNIVGDIIMPTPMSVLKGASLLSKGFESEQGLGDLVVVDIGGATTDIHSIGKGNPANVDRVVKGLPEPFDKRTVEGDLGIRYNACSILEIAGESKIRQKLLLHDKIKAADIKMVPYLEYLKNNVEYIPQNKIEETIDTSLAATAVEIAIQRHAGKIEEVFYPTGKIQIQIGKDLSQFNYIIGTGGIFTNCQNPYWILKSACYNNNMPNSLLPVSPTFFIDKNYILYAIGLLSVISKTKALRIMKKYLATITKETYQLQ